jgi:hypothetical protein
MCSFSQLPSFSEKNYPLFIVMDPVALRRSTTLTGKMKGEGGNMYVVQIKILQ